MRTTRHRDRHQMTAQARRPRGVALVEFALILPLLLLLSFLTFEFGRAIHYYNTLAKAAREASRYISTQAPGTFTAETRNIIIYGNPAGTGSPRLPGLSLANVPVPDWGNTGTNPVVGTVTVRVQNYVFTPIFVGAFSSTLGAITFNEIRAVMRSPNVAPPT